jgi:hypothetical protein
MRPLCVKQKKRAAIARVFFCCPKHYTAGVAFETPKLPPNVEMSSTCIRRANDHGARISNVSTIVMPAPVTRSVSPVRVTM